MWTISVKSHKYPLLIIDTVIPVYRWKNRFREVTMLAHYPSQWLGKIWSKTGQPECRGCTWTGFLRPSSQGHLNKSVSCFHLGPLLPGPAWSGPNPAAKEPSGLSFLCSPPGLILRTWFQTCIFENMKKSMQELPHPSTPALVLSAG